MTHGVTASLNELLALKQHARVKSLAGKAKAVPLGMRLSSFRGRGMDFSEARHYQPGDEIRHMEWRVTARTGKPHVKIYQEERERPVVLLVDFNPSMFFGTKVAFKSVIAARLAALLAFAVTSCGDKVGGLLFSAAKHNEFVPKARHLGVLPLLSSLSQYTCDLTSQHDLSPQHLSDVLIKLRRVARPGSVIVLISDFYAYDETCDMHLSVLRQHNDVLAYVVCDPLELAAPAPNYYGLSDGTNQLSLDTRVPNVRKAYNHYCEKRIAEVLRRLNQLQIKSTVVSSEAALMPLILDTFPWSRHG